MANNQTNTAAAEKPKLYITVEGGVVTDICSPTPDAFNDVEVVLVDYDTDGLPEDVMDKVHFEGGSVESASICFPRVKRTKITDTVPYQGKKRFTLR